MGRVIMNSFVAGMCFIAMLVSFITGKYFLGATNAIFFVTNLAFAIHNSQRFE